MVYTTQTKEVSMCKRQSDGAAVVAVRTPTRILLIRELRKSGVPFWKLPGGTMETGESPVQTAWRELKEEAGLWLPIERFELGEKARWVDEYKYLPHLFIVRMKETFLDTLPQAPEGFEVGVFLLEDLKDRKDFLSRHRHYFPHLGIN